MANYVCTEAGVESVRDFTDNIVNQYLQLPVTRHKNNNLSLKVNVFTLKHTQTLSSINIMT